MGKTEKADDKKAGKPGKEGDKKEAKKEADSKPTDKKEDGGPERTNSEEGSIKSDGNETRLNTQLKITKAMDSVGKFTPPSPNPKLKGYTDHKKFWDRRWKRYENDLERWVDRKTDQILLGSQGEGSARGS